MLHDVNTVVIVLTYLITLLLLFIKEDAKWFLPVKIYFVVMSGLEVFSSYLANQGSNNHYLFYIYSFLEITMVTWFFYYFIREELKLKAYLNRLLVISGFCLLGILLNTFYFRRVDITMTLLSTTIIFYGFMSFYLMINTIVDKLFPKYFIISLFLIHSMSLMIFLMKDIVFTLTKEEQYIIFIIRSIILLLAKLLLVLLAVKLLIQQYSHNRKKSAYE